VTTAHEDQFAPDPNPYSRLEVAEKAHAAACKALYKALPFDSYELVERAFTSAQEVREAAAELFTAREAARSGS
jgi:hypothetical protein